MAVCWVLEVCRHRPLRFLSSVVFHVWWCIPSIGYGFRHYFHWIAAGWVFLRYCFVPVFEWFIQALFLPWHRLTWSDIYSVLASGCRLGHINRREYWILVYPGLRGSHGQVCWSWAHLRLGLMCSSSTNWIFSLNSLLVICGSHIVFQFCLNRAFLSIISFIPIVT